MSHFTTPRTARKSPPYRPPSAATGAQLGLFAGDTPAPAAELASRPRPVAPPRDNGIPRIRVCGQLFDIRTADDAGNQYSGPVRIFDFIPPDRQLEVTYRVTDHLWSGPRCWCQGLPRNSCVHVQILIAEGFIPPREELSARWSIVATDQAAELQADGGDA